MSGTHAPKSQHREPMSLGPAFRTPVCRFCPQCRWIVLLSHVSGNMRARGMFGRGRDTCSVMDCSLLYTITMHRGCPKPVLCRLLVSFSMFRAFPLLIELLSNLCFPQEYRLEYYHIDHLQHPDTILLPHQSLQISYNTRSGAECAG